MSRSDTTHLVAPPRAQRRSAGSDTIQIALGEAEAEDEAAVVSRLRAGDPATYEQVVRTHAGRMLAVARRLLNCEDSAQDAVQEAFISLLKNIGRFEGQARLATWLHRIVVNASLMKLRSLRRRDERSIEQLLPTYYDDGCRRNPRDAWTQPAESLLEQAETRARIRQMVNSLPDDYRTVLLLRDVEELSTDEAAEYLKITPGAVKTRLHRARMALRELLEKELT